MEFLAFFIGLLAHSKKFSIRIHLARTASKRIFWDQMKGAQHG